MAVEHEGAGDLLDGMTFVEYRVCAWSPSPEPEALPVAVALALRLQLRDGRQIDQVLRLKNPGAVDKMIRALEEMKRSVWPHTFNPPQRKSDSGE
jgi:hypothetical protein